MGPGHEGIRMEQVFNMSLFELLLTLSYDQLLSLHICDTFLQKVADGGA